MFSGEGNNSVEREDLMQERERVESRTMTLSGLEGSVSGVQNGGVGSRWGHDNSLMVAEGKAKDMPRQCSW